MRLKGFSRGVNLLKNCVFNFREILAQRRNIFKSIIFSETDFWLKLLVFRVAYQQRQCACKRWNSSKTNLNEVIVFKGIQNIRVLFCSVTAEWRMTKPANLTVFILKITEKNNKEKNQPTSTPSRATDTNRQFEMLMRIMNFSCLWS